MAGLLTTPIWKGSTTCVHIHVLPGSLLGSQADVLNRGFSDGTTRRAAYILPGVLKGLATPPELAIMFFGARDAYAPPAAGRCEQKCL